VLQERKVSPLGAGKEVDVDLAVICATNKNLKEMIANGEFREDLYYRLNGLVVRLPALRDREDLEIVTQRILASVCRSPVPKGIAPDVMEVFHRFGWPGNFRQLFNLLRTAVVMANCAEEIQMHHLPDDFLDELRSSGASIPKTRPLVVELGKPEVQLPSEPIRPPSESSKLENVALDTMALVLRANGGNVSVAAKLLGVSRNTIYRKKALLPDDVWG
jgi:transcriptional regulator of acetoin/glycerol metabolism